PVLTPTLGTLVWLPGELPPGGSGSIIVTVRVHSPLPDLTVINNRIDISSVEQPTPASAMESTLAQSPILALTKLSNVTSPQANSLLTYTLLYTNSGSTYATSVVVTDVLPGHTTFQDCAPIGCVYNPLTRKVTWNPGAIASQDVRSLTLTLAVVNNLLAGTLLTNTAGLVAAENIEAAASLTNVVASQPILNLTIGNGVSNAMAGEVLTYTLAYFNSGNSPAQNVVITNHIPSPATFVGCSNNCLSPETGVYSFAPGTVTAGSGGVVTLSVEVSATLPAGLRNITATALITTTTPTVELFGHSSQDVDAITTSPILTLAVDYDSSVPVEGKIITYTLTYTNPSGMDTTGVVFTVTRSPYATQASTSWQANGEQANLFVGDLPAGESGIATFAVTLPLTFTPGMAAVVNDFAISDNGPGGLPVASAMTTTLVGVPDLIIDSVTLSPPIIVGGTEFTATVIVRNAGTGRACNPNRAPCGRFYLDAFIDPAVPPPSFPYDSDGFPFLIVDSLDPGGIFTVTFEHLHVTFDQRPILYFKIDNYACPRPDDCAPSFGQRGLVPESNEHNNVFGPVSGSPQYVYLPLVRK
ncbi:MAG: hypothetical protein HY870_21910, partial [Chloroflexi bacterium]|nr:hypothetical protein [Chloroflexota bacterium]